MVGPRDRTRSSMVVLHTPVTSAPKAFASCTGVRADSTRSPDDQHVLPLLQAASVAHGLQCGELRPAASGSRVGHVNQEAVIRVSGR